MLKDGLRSFLSAAHCQKRTAKKCSGADKKSSTFQKWSPRCVFRKISLSAGVSTIGEDSNGGGLVTNGITDKQRKSMTSVVFDHGDNAQSSRCRHGLHCLHGLDLVYAEKGPLAAADPRSRRM